VNSHCERIGHGGASALERANTLASFDMAAGIGVDMIEFDVRAFGGELVLAHTMLHARRGGNVRFRDALAHLASPRFDGVGLNVDVKHRGCEPAVLEQLRHAGLLHRSLICSQVAPVLDRVRELEPHARTGVSVGGRLARASRRWGDWRRHVLAGLAGHRWDAVMAQHKLIDANLLEDVVDRGGRLYAWTVNERPAIGALRRLGVHGIATADPRLFA
jgi:glycerophosphoryl diester phosphodiesterase